MSGVYNCKNLVAVYSVYLILCLLVIPDQSFVSRVWLMEQNMLVNCLLSKFVC
jgi:hypothetical protein